MFPSILLPFMTVKQEEQMLQRPIFNILVPDLPYTIRPSLKFWMLHSTTNLSVWQGNSKRYQAVESSDYKEHTQVWKQNSSETSQHNLLTTQNYNNEDVSLKQLSCNITQLSASKNPNPATIYHILSGLTENFMKGWGLKFWLPCSPLTFIRKPR